MSINILVLLWMSISCLLLVKMFSIKSKNILVNLAVRELRSVYNIVKYVKICDSVPIHHCTSIVGAQLSDYLSGLSGFHELVTCTVTLHIIWQVKCF